MKNTGFTIKSRLWICFGDTTYLGEGRIELLSSIEDTGSISKAAKNMGMSYKKAWDLVNSMNRIATTPLVIRIVGGINGGGSILSEEGKDIIRLYKELTKKNRIFLQQELEKINCFQL